MSERGIPSLGRRGRFDREVEFREKFARFDRRHHYEGPRVRVEQIAHPEHLYYSFLRLKAEGGLAPGPDGVTYADLSPEEVWGILRAVSRAILAGVYRPAFAREKRIAKSTPGQFRTLLIRNLIDRVVGKALQVATRPFWERRFRQTCYAYRPRRGIWDMLAAVEVAMRRTGWRVLAIDDIMTDFDTVPVARAVHLHFRALDRLRRRLKGYGVADRDRTAALIESVLRGDDVDRATGIDQGGCYSPTALNVLLSYDLDRPLRASPTKPHSFRYSDNLAYLVERVSDGRAVLDQANHLLQPNGMALKGADGVHDLTTGATPLLGFNVRWTGGLDLRPAAKTWETLRRHLRDSYDTPVPARTALQQLRAWVAAYAPAVTDSDVGQALALAADHDLREFDPTAVTDAWRPAWERWQRCRARASQRYRPTP